MGLSEACPQGQLERKRPEARSGQLLNRARPGSQVAAFEIVEEDEVLAQCPDLEGTQDSFVKAELIDVTREPQTVELNITRVVGDSDPRRSGQRSDPSGSLGVLLGTVHKDFYLAEI